MPKSNLPKFTIYIEPELLARLRAYATKERRSISQCTCLIIENFLNAEDTPKS